MTRFTLIALLLLTSCQTTRTRQSPPPSLEARAEAFEIDGDSYRLVGYRHEWTAYPTISTGDDPIRFINAYDDVIVTQDRGSVVSVLEAGTGRERWSHGLAGPLNRFVGNVRTPGTIFASSESELFGLDILTGELTRRERFDRVVNTRPVIVGETAVYGTASGEILAHHIGHGVKAWGHMLPGAIEQPPVFVAGSLGAIAQTGEVIFLSPDGRMQTRARMYEGADTRPVAGDQFMYVASLDQRIYAMSPYGGIEWQKLTSYPLEWQPTYHDGVLYCATRDQGLLALDGLTGSQLWSNGDVHGEVVAERDGWLLVWDGSHAMTLDPETGDVIERVELPNVSSVVFDDFVDGNMYVVSTSGLVAKFIPRS